MLKLAISWYIKLYDIINKISTESLHSWFVCIIFVCLYDNFVFKDHQLLYVGWHIILRNISLFNQSTISQHKSRNVITSYIAALSFITLLQSHQRSSSPVSLERLTIACFPI